MAQPNCKYVLDSKQIFLALKIRRNFSYASPLNAKRILRCCQKAVILVVFLHQLFILEIIQHHMLSHSSLNVAYVISKWTNIMKSTRCSLNRVLLTISSTLSVCNWVKFNSATLMFVATSSTTGQPAIYSKTTYDKFFYVCLYQRYVLYIILLQYAM